LHMYRRSDTMFLATHQPEPSSPPEPSRQPSSSPSDPASTTSHKRPHSATSPSVSARSAHPTKRSRNEMPLKSSLFASPNRTHGSRIHQPDIHITTQPIPLPQKAAQKSGQPEAYSSKTPPKKTALQTKRKGVERKPMRDKANRRSSGSKKKSQSTRITSPLTSNSSEEDEPARDSDEEGTGVSLIPYEHISVRL
jgi:hypothetical protein